MYFYIPPYEPQTSHHKRHIVYGVLALVVLVIIILAIFATQLKTDHKPTTSKAKTQPQKTITRHTPFTSSPPGDIPGKVGPTTEKLKLLDTLTVSQNGAIVEGVDVDGEIRVNADNVTIRNFRANNVSMGIKHTGLILEDGELHGAKNSHASGVISANYIARRLNVHGLDDGFKANGNVTIENCWVHDLAFRELDEGTSHNDGVQISSGSTVTIINSRFERIKGTSAIFIKPDQGAISNVTLSDNILGGGAYSLYVVNTETHGAPTEIKILRNTFLNENEFGPMNIETPGVILQENRSSTGGAIG